MRVPMVQVGVVAVLRVIFRSRLTRRPVVSVVSTPSVATVDTTPRAVNCWPLLMEQRAGLATAA